MLEPSIIVFERADISIFQSKSFPMLSTSIFSSNGSVYHQHAVFDAKFALNTTALDTVGLPHLTGSNVWHNITANLAVRLPSKLISTLGSLKWLVDRGSYRTLHLVLGSLRRSILQICEKPHSTRSPLPGMITLLATEIPPLNPSGDETV
jgi:hypothetical protein